MAEKSGRYGGSGISKGEMKMYLMMLNEEEKELFLSLAYNIAAVDGNYSKEEKDMILGYCQEMQIAYDEKKILKPIQSVVEKITECSEVVTKKIIVFEIIGLSMADNNYDENERRKVKMMEEKWGIEEAYGDKCEDILKEYFELQEILNQLVLE